MIIISYFIIIITIIYQNNNNNKSIITTIIISRIRKAPNSDSYICYVNYLVWVLNYSSVHLSLSFLIVSEHKLRRSKGKQKKKKSNLLSLCMIEYCAYIK